MEDISGVQAAIEVKVDTPSDAQSFLGDGSHISGVQAQLELDLGDDSDCGVHAETELDVS